MVSSGITRNIPVEISGIIGDFTSGIPLEYHW